MKTKRVKCWGRNCRKSYGIGILSDGIEERYVKEGWTKVSFNDMEPVIYCPRHRVSLEVKDKGIY